MGLGQRHALLYTIRLQPASELGAWRGCVGGRLAGFSDVSTRSERCVQFSRRCVQFSGSCVQFPPPRALSIWSSTSGRASSLRSEYRRWPSRDSQATGADASVQGEPGPGMAGAGNSINACDASKAISACVAGRGVVRLGPPGTAPWLTANEEMAESCQDRGRPRVQSPLGLISSLGDQMRECPRAY